MSMLEICLVLTSLLAIGLGFYGLKHDFSLIASKEMLRKDLVRWQVFGDNYPSPDVLVDVRKSWRYLRVMIAIGGGVVGMLVAICIVVISLRTTGTVAGLDLGDATFFTVIFYGSFFVGFGMGGIFAVWRLRQSAKRQITYADLRQRRLSDYRSVLFRWLALVALVETIAFSWFFAPHLGSTLRLLQSDGSPVDIPNRLWVICIAPGAIVVIATVAEFLMSRIARLSRLLITSDPTISQRADDMLRETAIGMIQAYVLASVFGLALLQNGLIVRSLYASGYWNLGNRPYNELSSLFFLLLILTLGLGGALAAMHGGLRGKVVAWPRLAKQSKKLGDG